MKKILMVLLSISSSLAFSQTDINNAKVSNLSSQIEIISKNSKSAQKVLSGKLFENIIKKEQLLNNSINSEQELKEKVIIYMSDYPTTVQIEQLETLGVECYLELWVPPLENHPFGFFVANMPVSELNNVLSIAFVKKMDSAEYENYPQNNNAAVSINSDDLWSSGYDGTGVKIAVLDSGLDDFYDGTDLPLVYEKKDFSNYPGTDNNVANTVTGHGTHVVGSVLGRGILSNGRINEGNGLSSFKGSAPDASLVFLKIGNDATGSSTSEAMIAAMQNAVNTYNADILTMSYGGWYAHHDGSSATEQTVDWVYSQGVPFFISAGNDANDNHHYSGTVLANSSSDFIQINATEGALLSFNLVWFDGTEISNDLSLEYYNSSQVKYSSNITDYGRTQSVRGTESNYSKYNLTVSAGVYYLKVVNNSSNEQFFHIYFNQQNAVNITFANPDLEYTIGQPASADYGFAVGAWTTRNVWYDYSGSGWGYGNTLDAIAPFSSRGPRVDGGAVKPNITAPGSSILSLRDTDVYTSASAYWIDNDGTTNAGDANYYSMQGTSMACPIAAGAAALLLEKNPLATPAQIYSSIESTSNTSGTGTIPNSTWGYGKLDILAASNSVALPAEIVSFTSDKVGNGVVLNWNTATEVNNYGFEIERQTVETLRATSDEWEKVGFVEGHGNSNSPKNYSFFDNLLNQKLSSYINYRLKQIDNDGHFEYSDEISVDFEQVLKNSIEQNHPNPFNPSTTLHYSIADNSLVRIEIYNLLGQIVAELINSEQISGNHSVTWNASGLSSGVYFARFSVTSINSKATFSDSKKLILMK
jgi:subtilisin family serine protease